VARYSTLDVVASLSALGAGACYAASGSHTAHPVEYLVGLVPGALGTVQGVRKGVGAEAKAVAAGGAVGAGLDELVHHGHANSRQVMRAAATLGVLLGGMVTVYEAGKGAIGRAWPQVLCFGLGAGAWELYTQYFR
jgi:hypothetical protein